MMTLKEAKVRATELEISGRSKMNKAELISAIEEKERELYAAKQAEATEFFGGPAVLPDYRSKGAVPLNNVERINNYADQMGSIKRITARQHRRIVKAGNRQLKRNGMFDLYPELRTESGKRKAEKASA